MHLLETYAVCSGALIGRCYIEEDPITLPEGPFITVHSHNAKGTTRRYSHWQEVFRRLCRLPSLRGVTFVQVGGPDDPRIEGVDPAWLGKTTYNSLAFLIKHAVMHIGFDSFPMHLASYYDRPMVCVFAQPSSISGPYFSSPGRAIILEPPYGNHKPSWSDDDPLRLIDRIPPGQVVSSVVSLLDRWHQSESDTGR